jgi:S-(hydroxymethyl)glutathione dehydrogenase/alcohol dehydrogenase
MARHGGAVIVSVRHSMSHDDHPSDGPPVQEKQLRGCWYGTSNVHRDVHALARLYTEGTLLLDELISQEIELAQVNEALEVMGSGEIARSVIKY